MDDPMLLVVSGLLIVVSAGFAAAMVWVGRTHAKMEELKLTHLQRLVAVAGRRSPERFPPGTVPVELAELVAARWRTLGYEASEARVLRMVSAAHRVMCEFQPRGESVHYNDGDRNPPSAVKCQAEFGWCCTFPDCGCPAVEPPPPPAPSTPAEGHKPRPSPHGRKG